MCFLPIIKKVKKISKKVLTKERRGDIIVKLSPRGKPQGDSERSLKIEQQEIKVQSKIKRVYGSLVNSKNLRIYSKKQ